MPLQTLVFENADVGAKLVVNGEPVRRAVTRGSPIMNGYFISALSGEIIECQSIGEMDFASVAEVEPHVEVVRSQSVEMQLPGCLHYPDFFVDFAGRPELHEIKSDEYLDRDDIQEKASLAARVMEAVGGIYSLTPYSSIRTEPVWSNVNFVSRRLHSRISNDTRDAMMGVLEDRGGCALGELAEATRGHGGSNEAVLWLIARCGALIDYFSHELTFANFRDLWVCPVGAYEPRRILPLHPVAPFGA